MTQRTITGIVAIMAAMVAIVLWRTAPIAGEAGSQQPVLVGRVTRVIDGDSMDVQLPSGPITVRLHSIDAPERDQAYGKDAFAALHAHLANRTVELKVIEQDSYDRQVAVVYVDGRSINAQMVQEGHAWAYRNYLTDPDYCRREGAARRAKAGLWASPTSQQIAPWEWRNLQRGEKFTPTDYSRQTVDDCMAAARAPSPVPAGDDCRIKGNISDSGRIYHVPGNRDYDSVRIDTSRGERWFCTAEEAQRQGWRPARR